MQILRDLSNSSDTPRDLDDEEGGPISVRESRVLNDENKVLFQYVNDQQEYRQRRWSRPDKSFSADASFLFPSVTSAPVIMMEDDPTPGSEDDETPSSSLSSSAEGIQPGPIGVVASNQQVERIGLGLPPGAASPKTFLREINESIKEGLDAAEEACHTPVSTPEAIKYFFPPPPIFSTKNFLELTILLK